MDSISEKTVSLAVVEVLELLSNAVLVSGNSHIVQEFKKACIEGALHIVRTDIVQTMLDAKILFTTLQKTDVGRYTIHSSTQRTISHH